MAAELIGATVEEGALVPNTSAGINLVAEGFPWRDGDNDLASSQVQMSLYPQPILSDLEFTDGGDLVVGLRDRHGDMTLAVQRQQNGQYLKPGLSPGDTLRARAAGAVWDVEVPTASTEYYYDRTSLAPDNVAQMSPCFLEAQGKIYMYTNIGPRLNQKTALAVADAKGRTKPQESQP